MSLPFEIVYDLECDGPGLSGRAGRSGCTAMCHATIARQTVPGRYEICFGDVLVAIDDGLKYAAWTREGEAFYCPSCTRQRGGAA